MRDDGGDRRAGFAVTISVPDISSFAADPAHPGAATGTVEVEGLTGAAGSTIEGGAFQSLVDEGDALSRTMRYVCAAGCQFAGPSIASAGGDVHS